MALWLGLVLLTLGFFYLVRGVLFPFVVAFVLATLLEPAVRKLRTRGYSRTLAVSLVLGVFLLGATAIGLLVTPSIVSQIGRLGQKLDEVTSRFAQGTQESNFFLRWNPVVQAERGGALGQVDAFLLPYRDQLSRWNLPSTQQQISEQYIEPRRGQIVKAVQGAINSFFGILGSLASQLMYLFLIPIILWMMLAEMENLKRGTPRWIPPSIRAQTIALFSEIGDVFSRYLRGVASVILLYTIVSAVLMWVMGVPYAILLGIVFGALYMIPYIGNLISLVSVFCITGFSGVTGSFFLHVSSPWAWAAAATIAFFIMGSIFDQIIYPRLVGSSVGLNGVVSIFVILCGGAMFGLVGMLLAFPLAGAVKVMLDRVILVTTASTDSLNLPAVPLRHRSSA